MKDVANSPMWVKLVYANIATRKSAVCMIVSCVVFALYCVPWPDYSQHPLVAKLFLINDWSWALSLVPFVAWYWLALKWVDKHQGWEA
jgi:hypothetical protein